MERKENTLATQMRKKVEKDKSEKPPEQKFEGNFDFVTSTGSTLLDLAISGGVMRGGGIPSGIMIEVFGPSGSGKTVLLTELAGAIQRKGGAIAFLDPEARLNKSFARLFDMNPEEMTYSQPDTVPQLFKTIRDIEVDTTKVNGVFADSLAALSTNIEMDNEDGDKMGMRRAKEFSEGLRKHARLLKSKNLLFVCSNQIRESQDAYTPATSPGGKAIGFYSSIRLRTLNPSKIYKKIKVKGKELKKVIGVTTEVEVFKNSEDAPYRKAEITIIFDYGIDDIRDNLQYLKTYLGTTVYTINGTDSLGASMEDAIASVEENNLQNELKEAVIDLWEEIQAKFKIERRRKQR